MLLKLTIILFINLSICIRKSSAADPTISYECTSQRLVEIKNITVMNDHRLKVLKENGEACDLNDPTINVCGVQPGDPVTLLLQEDNTTEVVGGHNSYKFQLNCTDEGVYTVISTSEMEVKPPIPLIPLKQPAYHAISLTIQNSLKQNLSGAVEIGQELKMIMKISDGTFALGPKKCTAKGTKSESYKIWEATDICDYDSSIIGEKWSGADQRTLEITMYGFYFPTSTHITIECLTKVCTDAHKSDCKNKCMTVAGSRRRREAVTPKNETLSYFKSVEVAFDVAVNEAGVNSAIGILPKKPILALMGITSYIVMQLL